MKRRINAPLFQSFQPFNRCAEPALSTAEGFKPPP
jgi:hypothetical protein